MRLCFQPLFFLPHSALRWAYFQALSENLMDTPFVVLFITIDRAGIWFPYKGDEVLWTWPWRRRGLAPFVSVGFSGTGEWGDARFLSLNGLDREWETYFTACEATELMEGVELAGEIDINEDGVLVARAAEDIEKAK